MKITSNFDAKFICCVQQGTLVWRWFKINLYELLSFKDIYTLLPTSFDVKVKYCSIFEFSQRVAGWSPLLNPEGAIQIKRDDVEKNLNFHILHSIPKITLKLILGYVAP